jgi:aldehyde dehydrogenase (NAD+)
MNQQVHPATLQAAAGEADPALIQSTFDSQLSTSLAWRSSTAKERIGRLKALREALMAERANLHAAFAADYRKSEIEVELSEIMPVMDELRHAIGMLKKWMKPVRVWPTMTMLGTSARIEYQPRGRVLIIAPWNYPLSLSIGPLVSALAAGNTAIIKPSEMTPAVSAVLARIVKAVFPAGQVALFEGSLPTSQALLALPFDHIFFTGSPAVGKVVMAAAAKHLGSITLELGGKSPTIVDQSAKLRTAAETLMWGKFINNGQTCVAPDYVYVHANVKTEFIGHCKEVLAERYGATAAAQKDTPDLTRVVNRRHTERVAGLLNDAMARGAQLHSGGEIDIEQCYIAPTLLDNVAPGSSILEEEIFGPLLPIASYTDIDQVIGAINAAPKPLALYIFSEDEANIKRVLERTSSGGACINHCVAHFAHGNLPFGGVNNSGIGSAHGVYGFKAFSHERAVMRSGFYNSIKMFFPPYTPMRKKLMRKTVDLLRLPML